MQRVRRALVSVSDKAGVVDLAKALVDLGVEILSTGGTARLLLDNGLAVTEVADYTGFPEIMDGRVKTLHPKIHGALLGRRGEDEAVMRAHGIAPIDLVVVNLYPFERTIARPDCTIGQAIETIDIGGPAMLRAAAKNHASVCVVVDSGDYDRLIAELRENHAATRMETRRHLATKAFEHTARYDGAIANYLGAINEAGGRERFPRTLNLQFEKLQTMRYGENPHQRAALYRDAAYCGQSISTAKLLHGKELSFNNVADADAAFQCIKAFDEAPACVIVKHSNPCGVALGNDLAEAYDRAFRTDPTSAFGGIIAFNRVLSGSLAARIVERQFVEVIVAPEVDVDATVVLAAKPNVRVLVTGGCSRDEVPGLELKQIEGGVLAQDQDVGRIGAGELRLVSERPPTDRELADLLFAWRVVKFVKSNAIVYCRDLATVGVGAGQMSRVYSARIAAVKAADEGLEVSGSVMASDAFFPFRDGVDSAASAGVRAVIQPGGSMRDDEVIAAANEHRIAMVFTGMRHFRH